MSAQSSGRSRPDPDDRRNLQQLFAGVSPEAQAEILSALRYAGLRDDDPALAILAVVRQHDRQLSDLCSQVLAAIAEAPERLKNAAAALSLAKADHEGDVAEFKEAVKILKESQKYTEKMTRWNLALFIGGLIMMTLCAVLLVSLWGAAEQANLFPSSFPH